MNPMKITGGHVEEGIVVGNTYNKYATQNPLIRLIMAGYEAALTELVEKVQPKTIHEVGCGEGYWTLNLQRKGFRARGTDFSHRAIHVARLNALANCSENSFQVQSIYDVRADWDSADLILCCEVLEHLAYPQQALEALRRIVTGHLIVSVPREPMWRALNILRGKYIMRLGNTPGHLQHWSKRNFIALLGKSFEVLEVRQPLPWTMLLCR
jgi:2-polyprenyl-3-methyl-5-hydroxy-6-metoxy-1,4-benzoquinol methylase